MPSLHQQALIDAPVETIWELVGDPNRHVEWWPTMVETECPTSSRAAPTAVS